MGFLGAPLTGYGCAGMNPVAYGLTMIELERQDSGIRSFCSVQSALAMYPIHAFGSEDQRERWLPGMARGRDHRRVRPDRAELRQRPGLDADPRPPARARRRLLCSQRPEVLDHQQPDRRRDDRVGQDPRVRQRRPRSSAASWSSAAFAGLSTPETNGKLSLRASITGEIVLDEVRVPASNLLPGVQGLKGPLSCLTQARYGIGWGAVGAAMSVYERARRYTLDRVQFNKPLAAFQLTQQKLVELHNDIGKGLLLAYHFGRLKQDGKLSPVQVSYLKRDNVRMALESARTARSMLGGNGIMGEFHIMRHLCNLETVFTYEGTHEIHTLAIGRAITGLDAFS
jgi:glutaryl-CoA dehydrogenase